MPRFQYLQNKLSTISSTVPTANFVSKSRYEINTEFKKKEDFKWKVCTDMKVKLLDLQGGLTVLVSLYLEQYRATDKYYFKKDWLKRMEFLFGKLNVKYVCTCLYLISKLNDEFCEGNE